MAVTTFDFDPKLMKIVDDIKAEIGAASRAEVLRRAITLLQVATEAEATGAELLVRKGNKEKQIIVR